MPFREIELDVGRLFPRLHDERVLELVIAPPSPDEHTMRAACADA